MQQLEKTEHSPQQIEQLAPTDLVNMSIIKDGSSYLIIKVDISDDLMQHNGRGGYFKGPALICRKQGTGNEFYIPLKDAGLTTKGIVAYLAKEGYLLVQGI